MHYCNWHVGDYASHTGHLTPIEDLAYRRILDLYYLHERPLNGCSTDVARAIRLREHEREVDAVLREFFQFEEGRGWVNDRAEREIKETNDRRKTAAKAGRASGKARRGSANGRSTGVERNGNTSATNVEPPNLQSPITNPSTPQPPAERAVARGADASQIAEPDGRVPVVELQDALSQTSYRDRLQPMPRRLELARRAEALLATGLAPDDVLELWDLAQAKADGDPGALLAHWLDECIWREVLDERRNKLKEREVRSRVAAAADPLDGVYGT
jgi:uncharacterized protein YdaU (DUF1376 family)